jgi:predicted dehydrogenase/threonine dehydrogenase-like Zn-dependent dehydrogenase
MKQVVQDQSVGEVRIVDVPSPVLLPHGVLVGVEASVISSGTERAKIEMGQRSLAGKARARPDLARKVVDQMRRDGVRDTLALVRDRLGTPQPLGYSAAGLIVEVGAEAGGLKPGELVACGGAGVANHAELVYVPRNLCAVVPAGVTPEQAAFATVGAIAMHGLRQAGLRQGDLVVVSGLGLIGQLTVRIARAYGHPVVGVDPSPAARAEVAPLGVTTYKPSDRALEAIGADAVLLTAATDSNAPVAQAPLWCRDRGVVVVVGDVGLGLERPPYYDREVELRFSRSYGPGRYDADYEDRGHDYPIGYVRWTEGRNLAEFLRLLSEQLLDVDDLISARYAIDDAPKAYERLAGKGRIRAIVLSYPRPTQERLSSVVQLTASEVVKADRLRVGVCGAGNFARKTLLPGLDATDRVSWASIATASGVTATHVGATRKFTSAMADARDVAVDPQADAVVVATRHDTHAALVLAAASAGKFVFVEKPLAISREELQLLADGITEERVVTGFNRRWSPAALSVRSEIGSRRGPLLLQMRVNAGKLPEDHWANQADQGGRLVGELCHFIDLSCHLVGLPATLVSVASSGQHSPAVEDTVQVLLHYADGSSAALSYLATGGASLPKERIEAHWDGRSAVIDDFRRWSVFDGKESKHGSRRQDKGNRRLLAEFVRFALDGGDSPVPFHQALHVTDVSIAVVESIERGSSVKPTLSMW